MARTRTTVPVTPASPSAPKPHDGRTHPPYPPEFKREAVRLARQAGTPAAQVARELGVSQDTLRGWIKQAAIDAGQQEGMTTDERQELTHLRRRVRVLEEEREILKKAAAFFAAESVTR